MKNAPKCTGSLPCSPLECLADAGCAAETLDEFIALEADGNHAGQLRLLAQQRKVLLERVHDFEKRIEYLDYLTYHLEHKNV